jgi:hypothetical protein
MGQRRRQRRVCGRAHARRTTGPGRSRGLGANRPGLGPGRPAMVRNRPDTQALGWRNSTGSGNRPTDRWLFRSGAHAQRITNAGCGAQHEPRRTGSPVTLVADLKQTRSRGRTNGGPVWQHLAHYAPPSHPRTSRWRRSL